MFRVVFCLLGDFNPFKPRPETTASVARNLVARSLGLAGSVRTQIPKEKRDAEYKQLKDARGINRDSLIAFIKNSNLL